MSSTWHMLDNSLMSLRFDRTNGGKELISLRTVWMSVDEELICHCHIYHNHYHDVRPPEFFDLFTNPSVFIQNGDEVFLHEKR